MMKATAAWIIGVLVCLSGAAASGAPAPAVPAASPAAMPGAAACAGLAQLATARLIISRAQLVPAGPAPAGPPGLPPRARVHLPEHCLVQGALDPRTGADGRHYQIGFELRLPLKWNGRFLFQGGGGLDGVVQPAIGELNPSATPALARGFAVVSTDSGHQGLDGRFGFDQQARLDFAYASIGKVTALAKHLIARFYGKGARWSYFAGCSEGGREAMMAAQRFPYAFNGIVAGDPGFRLSAAAVAEMWDTRQFDAVAPHDAQGRPILSEAFSPAQLQRLSQAVLRQCDALDGLADGMINDFQACHFDPAVIQCRRGAQPNCLSGAQVAALRAVFGGAHDSAGHALYSGWPYDAGIGAPGWRAWKLGTSRTGKPNAINATLGLDAVRDYFLTPPQPGLTIADFNFDRDAKLVDQTAAINNADSTFLTSFVAHRGRMIIYQGLSDPVFSADDIIHWYRQLTRDDGPPQAWARLFLVPGMTHCGGGPSTDQFDMLTAIQAWTERGVAPDRVLAHGRSFPGVTRPLCPYPKYARYAGGNPKAASSFRCE